MAEEYDFDEGDMCEIPDLADTSDFDNQFQALDVGKLDSCKSC